MVGEAFEVALGLDRRHRPAAGGGDRLAEMGVLDVAGGEDPGDAGGGVVAGDDVALFVQFQLAAEKLGIGGMADGDEQPVAGEVMLLVGADVAQPHSRYPGFLVAEDPGHHRVPAPVEAVVLHRPLLQNRGGAQRGAAVDDGHLAGEAGEEGGLLEGGIAAADHYHLLVAVEEGVAGGADRDPAPHQLPLVLQAEHLRRGPG